MPRFVGRALAGTTLAFLVGFLAQGEAPETGIRPRDSVLKERLLLRAGGNVQSEAAVADGLKWLSLHQSADGSWGLHDFPSHAKCNCSGAGRLNADVAGTAFALLPFLGAGHTHRGTAKENLYASTVERGLKYLLSKQDREGRFEGIMATQGLATQTLCLAYHVSGDPQLREPAQRAIHFICAAQRRMGAWGYTANQEEFHWDTEQSAWQMQALRQGQLAGLQVPRQTLEQARHWLDESACDEDGATYAYSTGANARPSMTAPGLLCRQYLGWRPTYPGLKKGVDYLLKQSPDAQQRTMYYYYYATLVMHHHGGTAWAAWNPKMRDLLIELQDRGTDKEHPHQKGSWSPQGWDVAAYGAGRIMMTSLALLTLEIYYSVDLPLVDTLPPLSPPTPAQVEALWNCMKEEHALTARQAGWALADAPKEAVPFLAEHLQPVTTSVTGARLAELLDDLDDRQFVVRRKAAQELEKLAELAEPALLARLTEKPSLDVRRRIESILEEVKRRDTAPESQRPRRALWVLEALGTGEARQLLRKLAQGTPEAHLTRAAREALQRLGESAISP